jgi:hypothetical protein
MTANILHSKQFMDFKDQFEEKCISLYTNNLKLI